MPEQPKMLTVIMKYPDKETHLFIPPHWGRGNKHDGWTPICGANKEISRWTVSAYFDKKINYCPTCLAIETAIKLPPPIEYCDQCNKPLDWTNPDNQPDPTPEGKVFCKTCYKETEL